MPLTPKQLKAFDEEGYLFLPDCFSDAEVAALRREEVAWAIVPIENSLDGSVSVTLDLLAGEASDVEIVGEALLSVRHSLIAAEPLALGQHLVDPPLVNASHRRGTPRDLLESLLFPGYPQLGHDAARGEQFADFHCCSVPPQPSRGAEASRRRVRSVSSAGSIQPILPSPRR